MVCSSINYINQNYYYASTIKYWTNNVEYNVILILVCSNGLSDNTAGNNTGNAKYGYYWIVWMNTDWLTVY